MKTTFSHWLEARNIRAWRFAAEHNLGRDAVRWLAGEKTPRLRNNGGASIAPCQRVAELTGLPLGLLVEEAAQAQKEEENAATQEG